MNVVRYYRSAEFYGAADIGKPAVIEDEIRDIVDAAHLSMAKAMLVGFSLVGREVAIGPNLAKYISGGSTL